MGAFIFRFLFQFICAVVFTIPLLHASPGLYWLSTQQQSDGGVYAPSDLATPNQSSLEALVTRQFLGEPGEIDPSQVVGYLASAPASDTEHLAAKVMAGILVEGEVSIPDLLIDRQNADGGFGSQLGYQSTPYDTFWALQALEVSGQLGSNTRFYAVQFLLNAQGGNGAWGYGVTDSVFLTARLQQQLVGYQSQYGNVAEAIERASLFLSSTDVLSAPLTRDYFGACTALSSLTTANNTQDLDALNEAILAGQSADGSWQQDVFSTAICLRALVQYEAGQQGTALSSISGQVFESGSNRPIAGVAVTLSGSPGGGVTTDQDGRFLMSGLSVAAANLEFAAAGYLTTVRGLTLNAGANSLGTVPMAKSTVSSLVRGTVVNATTAEPVSGATVSLAGTDNYQTTTDSYGNFSVPGVSDGAYTVTVSRVGYHDGGSSVSVVSGNSYDIRLQLADTTTVLDDTPAQLSGRAVDGTSGLPLSATVVLDGGPSVTTATDGLFSFENVIRGAHQLTLSGTGYVGATYNLNFPAGANGSVGDLALYPTSANNAATDINLTVTVVDAVSGTRIAGAAVADGISSAITNASGVATLMGQTELSFTVQVTAEGYRGQSGNVTVTGFGDFSLTFALTPATEELDSLSLEGAVTDTAGNPIEGALVDVDDAGLGIVTDATGAYSITGIDALSFGISVSKSGYQPHTRAISVEKFGRYILDVTLEPVSNEGWQVYYVSPETSAVGAEQEILFTTSVQNLGTEERTVIIRGQAFDAGGAWAGDLAPFGDQPPATNPLVTFQPGEVKVLTMPFNTRQLAAGEYLVNVNVVEEGSISRDLPNGVVYTSGSSSFAIVPTDSLEGDLDFLPPLTQAGADTPVSLRVLIDNTGNTLLAAGDYQLRIRTESGDELLSRTTYAADIPAGSVQLLDFGEWTPDVAGHLSVQVNSVALPDAGEVMDIYYVGDLASAEFRLDEYVFPEGNQQTKGHLSILGVDTTQGTSTDPLFERAIEAVRVGGQFVGSEAVAWHRRNRCQGCHIQTQSLVGMASAAPYTDIDENQTRFLYNTLASSQQNDGRMRISHEGYRLTQQQFASWSLVEWPNKAQAHRTKLKGLQYLWSRQTTSGDRIYINHDHNTGWASSCCEGGTAITARAISDLIQADRELDGQVIEDYQRPPDRALNGSKSQPIGTHISGALLTIAKRGMIEQYDLDSGVSEPLFIDGANRQFIDVVVDTDGSLYVTTDSHVLKIQAGEVVNEVRLDSSGLRDIVLWNGALYVADHDNHRIWRVSTELEGAVFVSRGPLRNPHGLLVSHAGDRLLVANYNGFNLISYSEQGSYEIFADGLAFRPIDMALAADGEGYYLSTQVHGGSATSPAAMQKVDADGTVSSMFGRRNAGSAVRGVAGTATGAVYVDHGQNILGEVVISELDRSFVSTLENSLPNLANYFLSSHSSDTSEIVRVAFRLMGLAEIRKVTTDPGLQAQIDAAIPVIEGLLRNRQRGDGGWGRLSGSGSDPLTTSWVGYALDYTNPSAEDPMVRNAITYLLNRQQGNGSWSGSYFTTRLGSTSMVMAYMPRALERLGGLDVSVEITTATDIDYDNLSITPVLSEPQVDGSTQYRWELVGVTSSGRLIDMDLDILDLVLGEHRPVAQSAHLEFANSFTGETIFRDIAIPSVSAVSGIGLNTVTDKSKYLANETVDIDSVISNSGLNFSNGALKLSIRTAAGNFVDLVTMGDPVSIAAGGQSSHNNAWNTALYPAGPYQVYAEVLDDTGEVQADAVAFFTILPSDGQHEVSDPDRYGTSIATDKGVYTQYNTVQLDSQVINEVLNQTQAPVLAVIQVRDPNGASVFRRNIVIQAMSPGAVNGYMDLMPLGEAPEGLYYASVTVWDASVTEQLASSETLFSVIERPLAHLRGTVTVDDPLVYRGQDVTCFEEVTNRSGSVTIDAQLSYQVLNVDDQELAWLDSEPVQFTPLHRLVTSHPYNTLNLAPGNYACVLLATVGNDEATLDFAGFTVELPPVEYDAGIGTRGRLLILLDEPGSGGTADLSGLSVQDSYLRNLLDANGFSYTIVYNGDDFATEFHSGLYHSYALMSEKVQLAVEVEHQLAEAVNAGAGMYIAGAFNRRNNHIERALGIHSTGRDQQADGVTIPEGALGPDWLETHVQPNTMLDFERCGALALGVYVNPKQGTEPEDPQCYNLTDVDAAVAGYRYGKGRAVYVGFDTLDEATLAGGTNPYSDLMLYGLQFIQPVIYPTREGSVIPLALSLTSLEVPIDVQMLIDLPDNVEPIDQVPEMALIDPGLGIWSWQTYLEPESSADAQLFIKLLDSDDISVDISIRVQVEQEWIEVGYTQLLIAAEPPRNHLADGILALEALVMNYPDESAFATALGHAQSAQTHYSGGDISQAVTDLQSAVAQLADSEVPDAQDARYLLDVAMLNLLAGVAP